MMKINHTYLYQNLERFMFNKTKDKSKKHFYKYCLQFFSSKNVLQQHRKICLRINGAQDVRLKSAWIKLMNKYKQIAAPFKICVDTEYSLEKKIILLIETKKISYTEKYQNHIPCSFAYEVACIDNKFNKQVALYREQMQFIN